MLSASEVHGHACSRQVGERPYSWPREVAQDSSALCASLCGGCQLAEKVFQRERIEATCPVMGWDPGQRGVSI